MTVRQNVRTIVGAVSLVAIGAVLGITADRTLHRGGSALMNQHLHELQADMHARAMSEFQERLHLDAQQRNRIDSVFRAQQASVDQAWASLRPSVQSAVDSVHAHIESILTPEQRAEFRAWLGQDGRSSSDAPAGTVH